MENADIMPKFGTTIAISIPSRDDDGIISNLRVKFLGPNAEKIDAVYCSDLYKE